MIPLPHKPYLVTNEAKGNGQSKPRKSKWHGKTVIIKINSPKLDIPSFEHGFVHVYDFYTDEYLGFCGVNYFATIVGLNGSPTS